MENYIRLRYFLCTIFDVSHLIKKKEENLQLQNKHQMKDEYVWLHAYGSDHWRDADKMHNKRRIFNDDWEMTRRWKCSDCEYTSELKLNCTREELGPPPLCLNEIEGKSQKFAKLLVELQKKVEEVNTHKYKYKIPVFDN